MFISKEWNWEKESDQIWLNPCEDIYYLTARWQKLGYKNVLDLGSGLGRHSVFLAKEGFNVCACDLSQYALDHLNKWKAKENLTIDTKLADMSALPYPDNCFDCLFSYHVISHTDSIGIKKIISEISRVLRPGGEFFITLCSKETWAFKDAGYPLLDENTVIKTEEGPEKDVPHFHVDLNDIKKLLSHMQMLKIQHINDCYYYGSEYAKHIHYFILGKKPEKIDE